MLDMKPLKTKKKDPRRFLYQKTKLPLLHISLAIKFKTLVFSPS